MNRIFHARITLTDIALLTVVSFLSMWLLWNRMAILALLFLILMVIVTEKMIHTTYTVTREGSLVIYKGRFLRSRSIMLCDITSVRIVEPFRFFGRALRHYVLVECEGVQIALLPRKEDEFILLLENRCPNIKS